MAQKSSLISLPVAKRFNLRHFLSRDEMAKTKGKSNGKRKASNRGLTKSQTDLVKSIIDDKLDDRIEDKFLIDSLYTSIEQDWSPANHALVHEISPVISQGSAEGQRAGIFVYPKFMRIAIRYIPHGYNTPVVDLSSTNPVLHGQVPAKTPLEVMVFRMTRQAFSSTNLMSLLQAVNVRFRPTGLWRQDSLLNVIPQELLKGITLLHRAQVGSKYFSTMVRTVDSQGGAPQCRTINAPLQSDLEFSFKFPNKKMLFENQTNRTVNYIYFMVCRQMDLRLDTAYTPVATPEKLAVRKCFVYEDA